MPRDWVFPIVLALFVGVVVWFGHQIYDFLMPSSGTVTLPSFVGQTLGDANAEIARLKLNSAVADHTSSDRYPKGVVIMQRPDAGEQVRAGRQISFVISDGIISRLMPDLRYQSMREVQFDLSQSHLAARKDHLRAQRRYSGGSRHLAEPGAATQRASRRYGNPYRQRGW